MAFASDDRFRVLHRIRICGAPTTVSIVAQLPPSADVASLLRRELTEGHVSRLDHEVERWRLTDEGRRLHRSLLLDDLRRSGAEKDVRQAYDEFIRWNDPVLQVCTRWQLRGDGSLNDHTDATYDHRVIRDLEDLDNLVQPICARFGQLLDRFEGFGPRLSNALSRVRAGDRAWFASPIVDSYHTVWFELHEDLLQTLGIERQPA